MAGHPATSTWHAGNIKQCRLTKTTQPTFLARRSTAYKPYTLTPQTTPLVGRLTVHAFYLTTLRLRGRPVSRLKVHAVYLTTLRLRGRPLRRLTGNNVYFTALSLHGQPVRRLTGQYVYLADLRLPGRPVRRGPTQTNYTVQ